MDIWFANSMRDTMLFQVGPQIASSGAVWTTNPPQTIQTQSRNPLHLIKHGRTFLPVAA
jgi:hypothetical protein